MRELEQEAVEPLVEEQGLELHSVLQSGNSEELVGGKIKGVYSYIDPVGSLIEVNYSMNPDKTDYLEERKVIKNYENDLRGAGTLSVEEVVERVLNELTPTVIEVVRSTVQSSSFDLSSAQARRELVQG